MEEISREEFERQKAESARRIREMYRGHVMPPYPEFLKPEPTKTPKEPQTEPTNEPIAIPSTTPKHDRSTAGLGRIFGRLDLTQATSSPDGLLILGLILLLLTDKADEKLVLALVFLLL